MDPLTAVFVDEKTSKDYADYRHHYSDEIFQTIVDYCQETTKDLKLAIDVGCGPGNSTLGLCKYFRKVIGVDISPTMIDQTPKDVPNCQFRVGSSHQLSFLDDESVDLFASGTSFFLMPQQETFSEADRILKPGGTIAIFGHGGPRSTDTAMDEVLKESFASIISRLPKEIVEAINLQESVEIPYSGWKRLKVPVIKKRLNLEGICAQWRLIQRILIKAGPESEKDEQYTRYVQDLLEQKIPDLDPAKEYDIVWESYLIVGHKPFQ